jgi:hypothetical protein
VGKNEQKNIQLVIPKTYRKPESITINGKVISLLDATRSTGISTGEQAIWNFAKQEQLRIPLIIGNRPLQIKIIWKAQKISLNEE